MGIFGDIVGEAHTRGVPICLCGQHGAGGEIDAQTDYIFLALPPEVRNTSGMVF
jgi:hypothetical protein